MSDISKIKLPSGEQYGIKDTIARNAIASHTHPIDTELDDSSTNPVQNTVITNALNNKADIDHTHNLESLGIVYGECNNTEQIIQIKTLKDNNIEHTFSNNDVIIVSNDNINISVSLNIDNTGNKPIYYNNEVITNSDELIVYDRYNIDKSDTKSIFIYDEVNDRYNLITTNRYATNNKLLNNHYGFCTTSELLDNKCIIIDNYYNINTNDVIIIKFAYNVNNNATLNINNTGNKPIYYKNTAIINGMINSGDIAIFMYDEVNDRYNLITTDDYLNENLNNYYTEYYKYQDTYYRYWSTLIPDNYILENGDVIIIVFNNNIISNAKLNINNTGAKPLYYRGFPITDGIIKTGDTCYIYYNEINNVYELLRIPSGSNRNTIRNGASAIDVYSSSITSLSITPYDNNQNLLDGNIFFTNIKISGDGKISNCTFNINNTGDKPIYYKGFPITDNVNINRYQIFRYDIVNDRYDFLTSTHHDPMINNNPIFVYENQHLAVDYNNIIKNNVNINDYKSKNNSILSIKFNNDIITGSYLNINDSKNKIISNSNNNFIHSIMIKAGDIVTFLYNNDVYNIISNNRNSTEYIYTYCQTSESESNKIISINNYNLKIGDIIHVYFYESVNANSTININNTGAKPIKFTNKINAGDVAAFLYDGDKYNLISIIDSKQKNIYCICNTAQSQNNKSISINKTLYNLSNGSIVSIKFTNAVNANSTININNIGDYPIYYKGSAITDDVIKAGNIVTFIYQNKYFYLVSIDSFNNAQQGFGYGICNSMVSDIYKYSVNINNYNNLTDHDILIIKFKNNVITNATLNINDTGDKPIYYNDSPIIDDVINAEEFAIFKYDETNDRYNLLITNNYTREKFNNVYYFSYIYLGSNMFASSSDNHTPIDKDIIILEFANISWSASGANSTININNSGNKPIYRNGEPIDDIIISGNTYAFEYDETNDRYNYLASLTSNNENYGESSSGGLIVPIDNYNIESGGIVSIKFNNNIDDTNATLNINYKGAKPIYYNGSTITDGIIKAGDTATFIYDGTNYRLISLDRDFNDPITIDSSLSTTSTNPVQNKIIANALSSHTHTNESMGFGYSDINYSHFGVIIYNNYTLTNGDIIICEFENDIPANATLNINNTGDDIPIYYNGSPITNGDIKAGDTVIFIYNENLDLSFSRFDFIGLYDFYKLYVYNSNSQKINIDVPGLTNGQIFNIKFNNDVPENATLNISSMGDIPIYYNGNPITNGIIKAGDTATFIYNNNDGDETNDRCDLLATDNYNNENVNHYYNAETLICYRITLDGYTQTKNGIVSIRFDYDVPANATLNINSTGAKSIQYNGYANGIIKAGDTATFIYDGTNYRLIALNNISNERMGFGYGTCGTAASTKAKTVSMSGYKLTKGGIVSIKFKHDVLSDATLNISRMGDKPIYYKGSAITDGIIKAGDRATFIYDGTNYNLISLDRDFNPITVDTALSTTSTNPVQNSVITNALNNKADANHTHNLESLGIVYAECYTDTSIIDKTASTTNNYTLTTGSIINIKFTNDIIANATLNINDTGAKPIYYKGSDITDDIIKAGDIATFIYDGTNYNLIATNNITNESMGFGYGECDTEEITTVKTVSISNYKLTKGGIVSIFFYYNVPVNATLNINNTGDKPIYCNGAMIIDNTIESGDIATFIYDGTKYNLISLDRDFNPITVDTALSTTSTNPVENNVITNALNNHTHTNESMGFGYSDTNYSYFCGIVDNYTLTDGNIIICEFEYNVSANATLSINSTGDKPIYYNGSPITDGIIEAGDVAILKYNENLDLSFSRFDFIDLYHFYELDANNLNSQEEINIGAPIYEIEIINGQNFNIRFGYDVPANATLNINGIDDDAKPIYYNGSPIKNNVIKANDNVIFIYNINDGRYDLLATDNYNNENVNHFYYEYALICYRITLDGYTQTKNGIVSIKFDYDVVPNATLNINDTGAKSIYYKGSAINDGIIKAGDTATFIYDGTNYNLISLDRDFNDPITIDSSLSTTSTNPVQNNVITNALNNKADANHTHTDATTSSGGLMSATDKANIDNFAANFKNKLSIANGIATLDSNGRVPSTQLPSYVDDIIEGYLYNNTLYEEDTYTTEIIGETGKIYVDLSTNKTYRWGGSNYIEISESLALGETSSTAYRGDYGKIAYEHAQSTNNPHNVVPSVYGYCYTERRAETKIVTINNFKLIPGMIIFIRFTYGVPYQAYLNISNTGAKPIYYKGKINDLCVTENGNSDIIQAGDIVTFIYDAANNRYNLISTNIIGNQRMGSGDGYCDTAASVNEKSVSIKEYVRFEGGIVSIYFVNAVNANSRLKINNYSLAYMYYKNNIIGNNIIKAGDRATFMYSSSGYYLISLDRDFNDPITIDSSLSTTSNNPVRNRVITSALNNYIPTIIGTQIESTNNWTGNAQFETLEDGQRILYYLPYDNSSGSDVVLNLTLADGTTQTGNINCYLSGSARLNSQYEAGSFIPLIYKENIIFNGSSTTYTGWWAYTDKDIDSKVQNTLNNTTKAYVTGTTNNTTNIGTQIFDDNVYLGTTAGELNTKSLKLNEKVTLNYNTNNNCIDFIFS